MSEKSRKPRNTQHSGLLAYHDIPEWQKDNEFLLSGYRPTSGSWLISLKSMLTWHNETVNIHSHTLGAVLFIAFPLHFYHYVFLPFGAATIEDMVLFVLYFFGVAICFACSVFCHVVWNLSQPAASFGNKLDFCGIILLMWGASLPSIHFAFICEPWIKYLHWVLVSCSATGCILYTLHPKFVGPAFRKYRALLYTCFGLSAILFVSHGIFLYTFAVQRKRLALEWMALMGLLNVVGAAFYASRLPERWIPYRCDFVGASHQIFHVLVLAAGVVHYKALTCALYEVRSPDHICTAAAVGLN